MSHPCLSSLVIGLAAAACGCTHTVKVEPIKVEPIHLTIDVNVRVERELDQLLGYEKEIERQVQRELELQRAREQLQQGQQPAPGTTPPPTAPSTPPAPQP